MKAALPCCYTIGQDLSANMVAYAARRLDEVHCGDCRVPAVDQASVDVVFCRSASVCTLANACLCVCVCVRVCMCMCVCARVRARAVCMHVSKGGGGRG